MIKRIIGIFFLFVMLFIGVGFSNVKTPKDLYQVYLDGDKVGVIESKDELLDLIDNEQRYLKNKYKVSKVYPPKGLEIRKIVTYNGKIRSARAVYEKIKDSKSFTLKGYTITITKKDKTKEKINVLYKKDFDKAVNNTIEAFVPEETFKKYINDTQEKVVDTGTTIENVVLKENITYRENFISTEEKIFTDYNELSRYLLFGTLDKQKEYIVKGGDTLDKVAAANNLSIEELLIANPELKSANTLIFPGQNLNIGLINPMISVVVTSQVVEKQEVKFKTEETFDKTVPEGTNFVEQKGENGLNKVTIKKEEVNGETTYLLITDTEEISPAVNKIIRKGGKKTNKGTGNWAWPTVSPYVVTSKFGWRWGRQHDGIDISGCGHGSPIYAADNGVAYEMKYNNGSRGTYIYVNHNNGYITAYLHLSKIYIKQGQVVRRGQIIGAMGNTGRSTGTHLHFGVYRGGRPWAGGTAFDPLTLYR